MEEQICLKRRKRLWCKVYLKANKCPEDCILLKDNKATNFLHNHPASEKYLGISKDHVIVDRKDWEHVRELLLLL